MKKIIIVVVVALLVCGGTIGAVAGVLNTPKQVASRALNGVLEELMERDELAPLSKILNGGSIEVKAEGESITELMDVNKTFGLNGKIYFGENAFLLDDLTVKYGDFEFVGDLYGSEDMLYVENEAILGGAWGLEKGELLDTWSDSIFAPGSGSFFAMDQETFDMFCELMKALDEDVDKELIADLEELLDRYVEKVWKLIGKYAEFESENTEVRLNKERENARVITITLDAEGAASLVEDLYEYIAKDKDLVSLVNKYGDRFADVLKQVYGIEDASAAFEELLADLAEEKDATVESIEEYMTADLIVTMVTPTMSAELLKLNVAYDKVDYLTVEFGHEGIKNTDHIAVEIYDVIEIVYEIKEDNRDAFKAELSVNDEVAATLSIDKDEDTYELSFLDDEDAYTLKGTTKVKGGKTTVTVESLEYGEYLDLKDLGVTLIFDKKDKMPDPVTEIQPLLSVDKEVLSEWLEKLSDAGLGLPILPGIFG